MNINIPINCLTSVLVLPRISGKCKKCWHHCTYCFQTKTYIFIPFRTLVLRPQPPTAKDNLCAVKTTSLLEFLVTWVTSTVPHLDKCHFSTCSIRYCSYDTPCLRLRTGITLHQVMHCFHYNIHWNGAYVMTNRLLEKNVTSTEILCLRWSYPVAIFVCIAMI